MLTKAVQNATRDRVLLYESSLNVDLGMMSFVLSEGVNIAAGMKDSEFDILDRKLCRSITEDGSKRSKRMAEGGRVADPASFGHVCAGAEVVPTVLLSQA